MVIEHYLISFNASGGNAHGYLMLSSEQDQQGHVEHATNQMMDAGLWPTLPMILVTKLIDDISRQTVRSILARECLEARALLAEAIDYHFSAWFMSSNHPDNDRLMRLH